VLALSVVTTVAARVRPGWSSTIMALGDDEKGDLKNNRRWCAKGQSMKVCVAREFKRGKKRTKKHRQPKYRRCGVTQWQKTHLRARKSVVF